MKILEVRIQTLGPMVFTAPSVQRPSEPPIRNDCNPAQESAELLRAQESAELLRAHLNRQQRKEYDTDGSFRVRGPYGRVYRLLPVWTNGVIIETVGRRPVSGRHIGRLIRGPICVFGGLPDTEIPVADSQLSLLLRLKNRTGEQEVLDKAER